MTDIDYRTDADGLTTDSLAPGFFDGWPNPPTRGTHLELLHASHAIVLALDEGKVVGFITAVSDGMLSAYIPLLEVVPSHKHLGIGTELVTRMLDQLAHLYMVDLLCDADLVPFYERFPRLRRAGAGFCARNYAAQSATT